VKDPQLGTDVQGKNPLDYWYIERNGRKLTFSEMYSSYDWKGNDGYANMTSWIETAAKAAGR
jgi:hypothetical protein